MKILRNITANGGVVCVCGTVVLFCLISLLSVIVTSNRTHAQSLASDYQVQVRQMLELNIINCDSTNNSILNVNITPSTTGTFKSNCQDVSVNTNQPGYKLTVKASTNTLEYLNPTSITQKPFINPTTGTTSTPTTLDNDTWGFATENRLGFDASYAIDNANNTYAAMPTSDITIHEEDGFPIDKNNHKFFYAAKLTPNTMAGSYMTTVIYTAIGEDIPQIHLNQLATNLNITTMQQLNESRCSTATYDPTNGGINSNNTITLNDTRNNQQYRVRKMPDNKCWMIDNLKLATPGSDLVLTSDDTDLEQEETFAIPAEQAVSHSNTIPTWNDPGTTEACANNTATNGDMYNYNPDSLTKCGYLYNWYAATAGTGTAEMVSGQEATSSICPVGWRLPSAGTGGATMSNEFAVLNGAMVGADPNMIDDTTTRPNWRPTGLFEGVYAGGWAGSFYYQSSAGYYWSSSASSASTVRVLLFLYNSTHPGSADATKSSSYSVRCVL